ncbi:phage gp16-like protein [Paucibacter oligotrophus]|uniref:Phage gp16-like protein n=1 Tax=Roseateles oligotrophus TaxID=1769250 RepID=A0A840LG52_9BURK|nr:regulatory protein GemA [Roseateles oligotrophus]MBB4845019.1 phage gp16-like protein [Roseateles oligotrophus]
MERKPLTQATDARARLVKIIHVARRELQLEEGTYRELLVCAGGASSTSEMDIPALDAVLAHLKSKGFKVRATAKAGAKGRPDRRQDSSVSARKVRALWLFLADLGVVRDPSERALAAYCKRIAKVDDLHWARPDQMHDLIETLKKWAMRFLPAAIEALKVQAAAEHRRQPFDPELALGLQRAVQRALDGSFDANRAAWAALTEALNDAQEKAQALVQVLTQVQDLGDQP